MVVLLEIKSGPHRNCHFSLTRPFDPIWDLFVSNEKSDSYCIRLSYRMLFYFFLLEIKSELSVVWSLVITTRFCSWHVVSVLTKSPAFFCCITITLQWSYSNAFPGCLGVNLFHSFLCSCNQSHLSHSCSSFYCVPLLSRLCDLFLKKWQLLCLCSLYQWLKCSMAPLLPFKKYNIL